MYARLFVILVLSISSPLQAQHAQPYAGLETRQIKALSTEEVEDLVAGRGMGLSLVAELNHYPGPLHVLEMSNDLKLSVDQVARVIAIREGMGKEAREIGEQIIAQEKDLDAVFAEGDVDPGAASSRIGVIARLRGELRMVHVHAHLATRSVLTAEQIARYDSRRGYRPAGGTSHSHQHGR